MYIIDRLESESAETLRDIKPGSYGINDKGNICYVSSSSNQVVDAISSKNSQSVISPRGPNCNQADALSVYAVKIQCDVSDEESESE